MKVETTATDTTEYRPLVVVVVVVVVDYYNIT